MYLFLSNELNKNNRKLAEEQEKKFVFVFNQNSIRHQQEASQGEEERIRIDFY